MSDIALYHPYFHFEDEGWLKAAALCWPKIARIVPPDCRLRDSDTVLQMIDELDLIVNVGVFPHDDPVAQTGYTFMRFLYEHLDDLLPRYGFRALGGKPPTWHGYRDPGYAQYLLGQTNPDEISSRKISYALARVLAASGLVWFDLYEWHRDHPDTVWNGHDLRMHPRLLQVYMAALASAFAEQNRMTPVTNLPLAHAVNGWTVQAIASVLLDDEGKAFDDDAASAGQDEAFVVIALSTIVPRGLDDVPVKRIIEARRRLMPELLSYRQYLDSLTEFFVELATIADPDVRKARLELKVDRELTHRMERLERELRRLRLEPARAVLSLKTLAPPALLAGLTHISSLPTALTATGLVSGCLLSAAVNSARKRDELLASGPAAGYLLSLRQELTPSDAVATLRSAFRRLRTRQT